MEDILHKASNMPDYISSKQKHFDSHKSDIFQELQGDKVSSLKDAIDDIEQLIKLREQLHKQIFSDTEIIKTSINNFITELGDTTNTAEQLKMRQKQIDIEELRKLIKQLDKEGMVRLLAGSTRRGFGSASRRGEPEGGRGGGVAKAAAALRNCRRSITVDWR